MKSQIKKELTLTLDEFEVKQLRNIIVSCPSLWENDELKSEYGIRTTQLTHSFVAELWKVINS
jgi:hypothetical protein